LYFWGYDSWFKTKLKSKFYGEYDIQKSSTVLCYADVMFVDL